MTYFPTKIHILLPTKNYMAIWWHYEYMSLYQRLYEYQISLFVFNMIFCHLQSYSADDLDKTTLIDDSKVDKILARKPGVTFNIQELICSILKDDSFINKLVKHLSQWKTCLHLRPPYWSTWLVFTLNNSFYKCIILVSFFKFVCQPEVAQYP
jgi:hypothetical protein